MLMMIYTHAHTHSTHALSALHPPTCRRCALRTPVGIAVFVVPFCGIFVAHTGRSELMCFRRSSFAPPPGALVCCRRSYLRIRGIKIHRNPDHSCARAFFSWQARHLRLWRNAFLEVAWHYVLSWRRLWGVLCLLRCSMARKTRASPSVCACVWISLLVVMKAGGDLRAENSA
jgi:hypothetical protein